MAEQASLDPVAPPRCGEGELFSSILDTCIEGIRRFPVDKRRNSVGAQFSTLSLAKHTKLIEPPGSLPSPPPSPQRQVHPPPSTSVTTRMDRSLLHGGPTRGHQNARPTQDARPSQDARSNFAVQPAANTGSLKLKKNAVKIVSAARPAHSAPLPQVTPATAAPIPSKATTLLAPPDSLSASGPRAAPLAAEGIAPSQVLQLSEKHGPSPRTGTLPPQKIKLPSPPTDAMGSIDELFVRLSSATPSLLSRPAMELSPLSPDKSYFSFEDRAGTATDVAEAPSAVSTEAHLQSRPALARLDADRPRDNAAPFEPVPNIERKSPASGWNGEKQNDRETEYLQKAATYFSALPTRPGDVTHAIKTVALKLRNAYAPSVSGLQLKEVEKLRARFVFAITKSVNKKTKPSLEPLTADFVKKVLHDCEGDLLQLCSALVKAGYVALEDLDQVSDLCQTVLDVLPTPEDSQSSETSSKASTIEDAAKLAPSAAGSKQALVRSGTGKDSEFGTNSQERLRVHEERDQKANSYPLEGMKLWPVQEKREHGAVYRACVLKGVGGVKSLNQLQALVWGGRLESIQMPEPGSEHALVKFLTPEACQTYLNATENGIEIQGADKKTVVFVDKQLGPNSINDVIQNCIDGDASRCVRATGADNDWSNSALFKLARGKQSIPRDVDRIEQGKTARGHHYIEFRFGNIYHALNFRRYLMDDEEWEHCSIGYAKDPCELARGVHYNDVDEDGGSSSA